MSEPIKLRFDGTVNLAMLGALLSFVVVGTLWVAGVNHRLDQVTSLLAAEDNNRKDIEAIRADLAKVKETSLDNNRRLGGKIGDGRE